MLDIVGNTFQVGDHVATDTTAYRSSHLRVGQVVAVEGQYVRVRYEVSGAKRSVLRLPNQVVKVAVKEVANV